ncbi:hypothetical protein LTR91_005962 [Friedmanniomyces endolithicus]|uniref:Uncharacterized protein n=1 Tax=Friedmanniomyces endolithicus TaxID=329885 RepID=A0AAN6KSX3_9PEZI|nr:hypothetical protein LTR94_006727 [Friedmanniomyces endolithicus]KAK0813057.1 hypothetical protein LTR38_003132 [Friedmanniomyces endolithicus]KAK0820001.1 hypothetical protein LTR75_001771 [Friedmanniomyces endolithicus]KAK0870306.1 hypothetical protein LTS02_002572 [Friedmanniomyces endolithicus]KAK0883875.1 hypothetical protein LTR87_002353 [Friedmanniomyces endolithicus]
MVKAKRPEVITSNVHVYAGRDTLIDEQVVELDPATPVREFHEALHDTIASAIRNTDHPSFAKIRNSKNDFHYDLGFRFAESRVYLHGIDNYPELNIDTLADLFPAHGKQDKLIDVVVNIAVHPRNGGVKKPPARDRTQTGEHGYMIRKWDYLIRTCDYFRLGISIATDKVGDFSEKQADSVRARVDTAKREKTISTYDALLAWRWSDEQGLPAQCLVPVSVHDFGDVCFGDCNRIDYHVEASYEEHIYLDYFQSFNREGTLEELKKKVFKYAGLVTPKQVGSGVPLLPSYTWTGIVGGPAFHTKWPKGGVKLAIQFVSRMPDLPKLVFPQDLVVVIEGRKEDEARIVRDAAIEAMQTCPAPTRMQTKAERKSCKVLFGKKYKGEWTIQLWAMQQDPAPRKLHLWHFGGEEVWEDGTRLTEFGLLNCLSVAKAREGDSRVFVQAVIGPKDISSWVVTGTEYTKHQPLRGKKGGKKEQKKTATKQKSKGKERKGKNQEEDEDEDAEEGDQEDGAVEENDTEEQDREDEAVEEEYAEEGAQGDGNVEEEDEEEEKEEKEEENAHAKSGKRRSGNAFTLSKRSLTKAALRKSDVQSDTLNRSPSSSAARISSKANIRSPQYIPITTPNMAIMITEKMQSS